MLETEYKAMLTSEQFAEIEKMFVWDKTVEQTNSYYADDNMLLKQLGITLRVRTIDGTSRIQVKAHKNEPDALQISEETEFDTDAIPDRFTADEVERMTGLPVSASLLGSLTTRRHSLMYADGVEICLDKSEYLGVTDYEIEVEFTGAMPGDLRDKLSRAGVGFTDIAVGKMTRFMRRLAAVR